MTYEVLDIVKLVPSVCYEKINVQVDVTDAFTLGTDRLLSKAHQKESNGFFLSFNGRFTKTSNHFIDLCLIKDSFVKTEKLEWLMFPYHDSVARQCV